MVPVNEGKRKLSYLAMLEPVKVEESKTPTKWTRISGYTLHIQ